MTNPVLALHHLSIKPSVNIDFDIQINQLHLYASQIHALVGESGSGKSLTASALLRLHPDTSFAQFRLSMSLLDQSLDNLNEQAFCRIRNRDIALMLQDPQQALNPLHTIRHQLSEAIFTHYAFPLSSVNMRLSALLKKVRLPSSLLDHYPHQLSGGQRQRVLLAIALAHQPKVLILDEPTTSLDAHLQKKLLQTLSEIRDKTGMAVLVITHDLDLVRDFADMVTIMDQGRIVEQGNTATIFSSPQHPATLRLAQAQQLSITLEAYNQDSEPLLEVQDLNITYKNPGHISDKNNFFHALKGCNLTLFPGQNIGIIGASGSGKSSFANAILQCIPYDGIVKLQSTTLRSLSLRQLRPLRKDLQMVFQDPYSSLNPRLTVFDILREGLSIHEPQLTHTEQENRVMDIIQAVDLPSTCINRFVHSFSGGQRQRIAIARALILNPKILVLDEPTTALDASIAKQVLQLLARLQKQYGLSYLFISHNCNIIQQFCHDVFVLHQGDVVESGTIESVFSNPQHPATQMLLEASPNLY